MTGRQRRGLGRAVISLIGELLWELEPPERINLAYVLILVLLAVAAAWPIGLPSDDVRALFWYVVLPLSMGCLLVSSFVARILSSND